jgi:hypothetical protein
MPHCTEIAIQKIIQDLIWEGGCTPLIALSTLELPPKEGGLNLLNIKIRNEAIDIMWPKSYLNFSPTHPTWAVITDLLINAAAPWNISPLSRLNT